MSRKWSCAARRLNGLNLTSMVGITFVWTIGNYASFTLKVDHLMTLAFVYSTLILFGLPTLKVCRRTPEEGAI